ncbi:MAG: hypothetical protein EHM58_01710 [Ignavibacteriae bacterium]|nr:MAG: hypothetical protein EHM58_01710 [Ignavibacteriota bacterium]
MTGKNTILIKIFIAVCMLFYMDLFAQNKNDDFREKVENIKIEKLITKLELNDNDAAVFTDKYKSYSREIRALNQKRFKTYKLMVENLESGNGIDTLVNQVMEYENELNTKRQSFADDLKTFLTPKQMATMIVFEKKFNNEIRKLLKEFRRENRKKE